MKAKLYKFIFGRLAPLVIFAFGIFSKILIPSAAAANPTNVNAPGDVLFNPLKTENLTDTVLAIMKGFMGILAIFAVMFVVVGGFRMVTSQGDEENLKKAKATITWAVIGLVIAIMSFAIIAMVQNLIGYKG